MQTAGRVFFPLLPAPSRCSVSSFRVTSPIRRAAAVAVAGLALGGCRPPAADIRPLDIRTYTAPRTATRATVPKGRDAQSPAGPALTYDLPDGWVDAGGGGLRLATLRAADGAEITVIQASGTLESNVARWQGQLTSTVDPARVSRAIAAGEKATVNGVEATIIELDDGAEPPVEAILAAVVPLDGERSLFVKFKGPAETSRRLREPFVTFLKSIRWQ